MMSLKICLKVFLGTFKLFVIAFCLYVYLGVAVARAETIHYAIMQMGFKAGDATLNFVGPAPYMGQDLFLIIFKAEGFNFLDEEKIYLNPQDYRPLIVDRNLNIFGHKERIIEEYIQKEGRVRVIKIVNEKVTEQRIVKRTPLDNIYAFIYRYRKSGSFKIGDVLDVNLPTKDLKIELVKRMSVRAAGKEYDSFFMQSNPAKYKIWFDSSDKKLPLRISGAIGLANTVMVMTGYEN